MPDVELDRVCAVYADGTLALDDLSLQVADGEVMVILGASGSGKTTLLRVVAGLEKVERGRVMIDGLDVTDAGTGGRDVAMVSEGDSLYPHLTAGGNLRFGLEIRRTPKAEIDDRVGAESRMLGLRSWLHRRPATLAAGEKQRVAVGRATVRKSSLLLLDEPLSHLDPTERFRLRRELGALIRSADVTAIIVTHDQEQAMAMGDSVGVMSHGRMAQVGAPDQLYRRPVNITVAASLGDPPMSLLPAWLEDGVDGVWIVVGAERFDLPGAATDSVRRRVGEAVIVGVRPEHVTPAGTGDGVGTEIELPVSAVEWRGGDQLLMCPIGEAGTLVAKAANRFRARGGDQVRLLVATSRFSLFDSVSGAAFWHGGSS